MNETDPREMVRAICRDLELSGCYEHIMPRVTADQLGKLLDVAEQGENAETWSHLVVEFFQHGNEAVIAAHIDRLVSLVTVNNDAYWVLANVPHLTADHCVKLVLVFRDNWSIAEVVARTPGLTSDHLDALVPLVEGEAAGWVLEHAPHLAPQHRARLKKASSKT